MNDNDLISRAAAIDALTDENIEKNFDSVYDGELHRTKRAAMRIIANMPTVDAVPVVHGRWVERMYEWNGIKCISYFCSVCEKEYNYGKAKYCPECGAKMDGRGEDG